MAEIKVSSDMDFIALREMNTPAVAVLNAGEQNTLKGEAVFGALIHGLVKFFGAVWTPAQIAECAKVCFDEWYYLSFAEVAHFAQRARAGYFKEPGKPLFFGQFSPANIIEWLCTYTAENLQQREAYYCNPHNGNTWIPPAEPVSDACVQQLKDVAALIEAQMIATQKEEAEERQRKLDAAIARVNDK